MGNCDDRSAQHNIQIQTMIHGVHEYGKVPAVLQHFITEESQHEYVPKKNDSPLQTIKHDHGITAFDIASRVFKGAALGLFASYTSYYFTVADKKILSDRAFKDWRMYMLRRAKTNVVIGSLAGLAWYFIHDQLLCPHGHATFYKSIAAHAVAGSLLYMAFWNPSNFFIGGVVGAFWGFKNDYLSQKIMPKDLQIQFGTSNPEARRKAIHDEVELELSRKLLASKASFGNHYAL